MDAATIETIVRLVWLGSAACFVLGLMRMNSPATARNGNLVSAGGMIAAILATAVLLLTTPTEAGGLNTVGWLIIVAGIAIGGGLGLYTARTVKMTAMPQLVSLFNAVGGGAAALIAIDDYLGPEGGPGGPDQRRDGPRHRHRLDHVHRLADRVRQAHGPEDHAVAAGHHPGRPDRDRRCSPRSSSSARSTCGPATSASRSWA